MIAKFLADKDPSVVLEATRAIHDVPIDEAMPALAGAVDSEILHLFPDVSKLLRSGSANVITDGTGDTDAFVRRAMNANYRSGQVNNALKVVAVAAGWSMQPEITDGLRLEALDMLGDWGTPSNRDRVLGAWRPIAERGAEDAILAARTDLFPIFSMSSRLPFSDTVQCKAIETIGKLKIADDRPMLFRIAEDDHASVNLRVEALLRPGPHEI